MKKPYKSKKVKVSVHIGEMDALLTYHWELYDLINKLPKDQQDKMTMAGWPLRETGQIHLRRWKELHRLKNETWPK